MGTVGFFLSQWRVCLEPVCSSLLLTLYILQIGLCTTTIIHDIESEILWLVFSLQQNYLNISLDLQNTCLYYFQYRHIFFIVYKEISCDHYSVLKIVFLLKHIMDHMKEILWNSNKDDVIIKIVNKKNDTTHWLRKH